MDSIGEGRSINNQTLLFTSRRLLFFSVAVIVCIEFAVVLLLLAGFVPVSGKPVLFVIVIVIVTFVLAQIL